MVRIKKDGVLCFHRLNNIGMKQWIPKMHRKMPKRAYGWGTERENKGFRFSRQG